jgi:hypothetical protein
VTTDFGTVMVAPLTGWQAPPNTYQLPLATQCADKKLIARTFTVTVDWKVSVAGIPRHFTAKLELEVSPQGQVVQVQNKQGSLYPELPLGRRYGGLIEERGGMLRARAPYGIEPTAARWHADGVTVVPTSDPLAVDLRAQRDGASVVCVMDVPGGVCIASWEPS